MSLSWCAELMLNPVVRWRVKRRSATHPNLDALTRGLKPHGYLQETAPRSSKTSKLQPSPPKEERGRASPMWTSSIKLNGRCARALSLEEREKHLGAFVVYGPNARQPRRGGFRGTGYNCEWVPSQKGIPLECLQAHQATVFASVISVLVGPRPVPLCDPSQNGWLFERPQAHHQ